MSFGRFSLLFFIFTLAFFLPEKVYAETERATWWQFQSIDTMKYSRDIAREKANDPLFDQVIIQQVKDIAATGATHIAIATPYDEEFIPFLKRWLSAARENNLKVWFRGNWSGWEGWFNYGKISRTEHIEKTRQFILNHRDLFVDGDVFTACPECENGGPGDPRHNGDLSGHRQFLIDEYTVTKNTFKEIDKKVASNYLSMNGDVAKLVMNKNTTAALDGLVVVDHYVKNPETLAKDIKSLAISSGGKIILGEFGAPIPDIHGTFNNQKQAEWLESTLRLLADTPELVGLNYWTNLGSSTAIFEKPGAPKDAVSILRKYYSPHQLTITVKNPIGKPLPEANTSYRYRQFKANELGQIILPILISPDSIRIFAINYFDQEIQVVDYQNNIELILSPINESITFKIQKLINSIIRAILP
jgi:hypothetical protein